jgi:hypothetical protein
MESVEKEKIVITVAGQSFSWEESSCEISGDNATMRSAMTKKRITTRWNLLRKTATNSENSFPK